MARLTIALSDLPDSLANRVQFLREHWDMTPRQLAQRAMLSEAFIQDIEAGMEMFLAPAIRLKLARALRIKPSLLQEVEKRPQISKPTAVPDMSESEQWRKSRELKQLLEKILQAPDLEYQCPECQSLLVVRQFHRRDLQDNPLLTIKIDCTQCLFRWSTD